MVRVVTINTHDGEMKQPVIKTRARKFLRFLEATCVFKDKGQSLVSRLSRSHASVVLVAEYRTSEFPAVFSLVEPFVRSIYARKIQYGRTCSATEIHALNPSNIVCYLSSDIVPMSFLLCFIPFLICDPVTIYQPKLLPSYHSESQHKGYFMYCNIYVRRPLSPDYVISSWPPYYIIYNLFYQSSLFT
ncbi:hypothetical protein QTP88_007440 [Uroleucon formosanum]